MCSRLCPLGLHAVGTAALLGSQAEARAAAAEAAEAWLAAFSGFTDAAAAAPPRSPGLPGAALSSIPGPWLSRVAAAAAAAAGAAPVGPRRRPRPPFPVAGMIRGALALDLSALDATTFGHGDSDSTDTVAASAADHVLPAALTARGHAVQVRVAGEGGALPNMDLPNLVLAALRGFAAPLHSLCLVCVHSKLTATIAAKAIATATIAFVTAFLGTPTCGACLLGTPPS